MYTHFSFSFFFSSDFTYDEQKKTSPYSASSTCQSLLKPKGSSASYSQTIARGMEKQQKQALGDAIAAKITDLAEIMENPSDRSGGGGGNGDNNSNDNNKNTQEGDDMPHGTSNGDDDQNSNCNNKNEVMDYNGNTDTKTTNKRDGYGIDIYITNDKFPTNFNNALDFFVINSFDTTRAITANNCYKKSSSGSSELLATSSLLSNPERMVTVKSSLFSIEHIIKKK